MVFGERKRGKGVCECLASGR
eukprot:SAG11_NODE_25408_length_359_cov_0.776923_2_plen_20_part_01